MNFLDDLLNPNDPFARKNLEINGNFNFSEPEKYICTTDPHPQDNHPFNVDQSISVRFFPPYNRECPNQLKGLINFAYHCSNICKDPFKNLTRWLEIGSLVGESASIFLGFPFIQKLYCVDFDPQPQFFKRMDSEIKNKRCEVVIKKSQDACVDFLDESLDVVYIDGDHSENSARRDLTQWFPKIRSGGFIGIHDYTSDWGDVKPTVDEFIKNNSKFINRYSCKTFLDGTFCFQKA
jgi:hypothetical protein